jgi:hypothetical protein
MTTTNENENKLLELNKTSKQKSNNYFDTREEEAVKLYIVAETKEEKEYTEKLFKSLHNKQRTENFKEFKKDSNSFSFNTLCISSLMI